MVIAVFSLDISLISFSFSEIFSFKEVIFLSSSVLSSVIVGRFWSTRLENFSNFWIIFWCSSYSFNWVFLYVVKVSISPNLRLFFLIIAVCSAFSSSTFSSCISCKQVGQLVPNLSIFCITAVAWAERLLRVAYSVFRSAIPAGAIVSLVSSSVSISFNWLLYWLFKLILLLISFILLNFSWIKALSDINSSGESGNSKSSFFVVLVIGLFLIQALIVLILPFISATSEAALLWASLKLSNYFK